MHEVKVKLPFKVGDKVFSKSQAKTYTIICIEIGIVALDDYVITQIKCIDAFGNGFAFSEKDIGEDITKEY